MKDSADFVLHDGDGRPGIVCYHQGYNRIEFHGVGTELSVSVRLDELEQMVSFYKELIRPE